MTSNKDSGTFKVLLQRVSLAYLGESVLDYDWILYNSVLENPI